MPSVTVTTVPTLRASLADWNFSIRALIRSLISDALIAITVSYLLGYLCAQALQASTQGSIDDQVVGLQHRAAQQGRVERVVQADFTLQSLFERGGVLLLLRFAEGRGGGH